LAVGVIRARALDARARHDRTPLFRQSHAGDLWFDRIRRLEWGVDLFAQDPLVFKKLIYEMRFDEASAKFAEFGPFYTGLQFDLTQLAAYLGGAVPTLA